MRLWGFLVLCFFAISCTKKEVKPTVEKKEIIKEEKPVEKILANIFKIEIPRVEKKSKKVKVLIWGARPDPRYGKQEIEINKIETGYEIKVWLLYEEKANVSLDFYQEVDFEIQEPGGYDIEVVGKNQSLIDIVFIDKN